MDKQEVDISQILKDFVGKLPRFPDGRIDYSNSDRAPVLTCFVKFRDKILLLKRSDKVGVHRGKWNTVAGYLDEAKPIREKALEELKEELGILRDNILHVNLGISYEFFDFDVDRSWIVYPVLVELRREPNIELDWEHTEFKWICPEDILKYDVVSKLDESLKRVLE